MAVDEKLFDRIEARYGFRIPDDYRAMHRRGWFTVDRPGTFYDYLEPGDHYLALWEMEWLPLEEIAEYEFQDYERDEFVPFAQTGTGDLWCWCPQETTEAGTPVALCPHGDSTGSFYAPNLLGAMYRQMLEFARTVEDPEQLDQVRAMIGRWSTDVGPLLPESWARTLEWVRNEPLKTWKVRRWEERGLLTPEELAEIVARDLAFEKLNQEFRWHKPDA